MLRTGRILMVLGAIVLVLSLSNVLPMDAYVAINYRGYDIYYDLEIHMYKVMGQTFSSTTAAKAYIDEVLGPPPPENRAPSAECDGPYTATTGVSRNFYSTGSFDPDGQVLTYSWTFGDGGSATGGSPAHKYTKAGSYTVKLTVKDPAGLSGSDTTSCVVTDPNQTPPPPPANVAPTANPGGPYTGKVGQPVYMSGAGSSDNDGSIVGYQWDFGDGTTGLGGSISHTYTTSGTFTVALKVTDDDGAAKTKTTTCSIVELVPAAGYWTINDKEIDVTGSVIIPSKSFQMAYVITGGGEYVTAVSVKISKDSTQVGTVTFVKGTNKWTNTVTLTDDGKYTLDGYIVYNGQSMKVMSIVTDTTVTSGLIIKPSIWVALGLLLVGLVVDKRQRDS